MLLALPLSATTALRERHAIDTRPLRWMLLGALPGTVVGLVIVRLVSGDALAVVVGAIALVGVVLSIVTPPIRIDARSASVAGLVSQSFGTAASVGGPPVALLYQHHGGPVIRSTLGAFFALTGVLSLAGLAAIGKVAGWQILLALALVPAMVTGFWLSRHLHGHVDRGWMRPAILVLSALAGTAAIVNGLT